MITLLLSLIFGDFRISRNIRAHEDQRNLLKKYLLLHYALPGTCLMFFHGLIAGFGPHSVLFGMIGGIVIGSIITNNFFDRNTRVVPGNMRLLTIPSFGPDKKENETTDYDELDPGLNLTGYNSNDHVIADIENEASAKLENFDVPSRNKLKIIFSEVIATFRIDPSKLDIWAALATDIDGRMEAMKINLAGIVRGAIHEVAKLWWAEDLSPGNSGYNPLAPHENRGIVSNPILFGEAVTQYIKNDPTCKIKLERFATCLKDVNTSDPDTSDAIEDIRESEAKAVARRKAAKTALESSGNEDPSQADILGQQKLMMAEDGKATIIEIGGLSGKNNKEDAVLATAAINADNERKRQENQKKGKK